jgi:hypothetical protein
VSDRGKELAVVPADIVQGRVGVEIDGPNEALSLISALCCSSTFSVHTSLDRFTVFFGLQSEWTDQQCLTKKFGPFACLEF